MGKFKGTDQEYMYIEPECANGKQYQSERGMSIIIFCITYQIANSGCAPF